MEEPEHTTRLTEAGFVVCVCGWATTAVDQDPREAAAMHIAATAPADAAPAWVDRAGGTVCIPRSTDSP